MMKRAITAATALLLAGCASVPHDAPQVVQLQPATLGLAGAAVVPDRWWDAFGDAQLDRLVELALADNPSLSGALARVRAAQASVDAQHAGTLPQVGADSGLQVERFSSNYIYPPPYGGAVYSAPTLQVNLAWDLDLFGRQHALIAQARSSERAAELDAASARLMIATAVAQGYAALVQAERQNDIADRFVATRQRAMGFVESRLKHQLATQFEARTAETLLAEARQAKVRAAQQRELAIHAIAALVGRGADFYPQITSPTLSLDHAPAVPSVLPADLLGRRPDLLAGQARIDAAMAGRRVARSDFIPNVNISALAGLTSLGLGSFLTAGSAQVGGGAALHLPIFEGGRLRAQYRGATADLDRAVADYNGSVVTAVRDSADAITDVRAADASLVQQEAVVRGLRETVRLDAVRTATGLGSRLDAVDSGFRLLEAEQRRIEAQANAISQRIRLIAALGGGFDAWTAMTANTRGSGS